MRDEGKEDAEPDWPLPFIEVSQPRDNQASASPASEGRRSEHPNLVRLTAYGELKTKLTFQIKDLDPIMNRSCRIPIYMYPIRLQASVTVVTVWLLRWTDLLWIHGQKRNGPEQKPVGEHRKS